MFQDNKSTGLLLGIVVGAAVGMAVGLLLAPQPGVEIRRTIRQWVDQGVERLRDLRQDPE